MAANYMRVNTSLMNSQFRQIRTNTNVNNFYLLLSLYTALFEYTSKIIKRKTDEDIVSIVYNHLIVAGLSMFQGISILHTNGIFFSIIPQLRTLYENSVIFLYIHKHKNLAEAYFDHGEATKLVLMETMRALDEKSLARKIELNEKYGADFFLDYGWTKEIITDKKDRKLLTLAEDILDIGHSTPFYKHLSSFVHSSAFSVNSFAKVDEVYLNPHITLSLFLMNKVICSYMEIDEIPQLHRVCIANLLDKITRKLFLAEGDYKPHG
jgi:hypothetical protein